MNTRKKKDDRKKCRKNRLTARVSWEIGIRTRVFRKPAQTSILGHLRAFNGYKKRHIIRSGNGPVCAMWVVTIRILNGWHHAGSLLISGLTRWVWYIHPESKLPAGHWEMNATRMHIGVKSCLINRISSSASLSLSLACSSPRTGWTISIGDSRIPSNIRSTPLYR